jgi:hypothetical protein
MLHRIIHNYYDPCVVPTFTKPSRLIDCPVKLLSANRRSHGVYSSTDIKHKGVLGIFLLLALALPNAIGLIEFASFESPV